MSPARISVLVLFFVLLSTTGKSESTADGSLVVMADTPMAEVLPRQASGKFIRLPSLEYVFRLRASCTGDRVPASLLLSVADTRETLDAEDLAAETPLQITLQIPSDQIGPIGVKDFCHIDDHGSDGSAQLTLSAVLSAHASLRCESDTGQSVIYVSKALDVSLICELPDEPQSDATSIDLD